MVDAETAKIGYTIVMHCCCDGKLPWAWRKNLLTSEIINFGEIARLILLPIIIFFLDRGLTR